MVLLNKFNIQNSYFVNAFYGFQLSKSKYLESKLNNEAHLRNSLEALLTQANQLINNFYQRFKHGNCFRNREKFLCPLKSPNIFQQHELIYLQFQARSYSLINRYFFDCLPNEFGLISHLNKGTFSHNQTHFVNKDTAINKICLDSILACKDRYSSASYQFISSENVY